MSVEAVNTAVGGDMGIRKLITFSDGFQIKNPRLSTNKKTRRLMRLFLRIPLLEGVGVSRTTLAIASTRASSASVITNYSQKLTLKNPISHPPLRLPVKEKPGLSTESGLYQHRLSTSNRALLGYHPHVRGYRADARLTCRE